MIALYNGKVARPDDWAALRAAVPYAQASSPHGVASLTQAVTVLARTHEQATIVFQGVVFYVDAHRAWAVGGLVVASRPPSQDLAIAFRVGLAGFVALFLFVVLGTIAGAIVGALGGPVSFLVCYLLFIRR